MARALPPAVRTPRPPWRWAVAGAACAALASLLAFAPARWAAAAVAQGSGGRVLLEGARGTVWDGSAQLVFTGGSGSRDATALPSSVQWRMRPAPGGLMLDLEAPCCTRSPVRVALQPRWAGGALRVADGPASHWPAGLLSGLGTPWNTLQLDGDLALDTQGLSLQWSDGRLAMAGSAQLTASSMASRITTVRPMGSYRLVLDGGATPRLQLSTLDGALRLSGTGQWVGGRLRFAGEASAAPEREAALSNLLNIIGRRQGARSVITIG